VDDHTQTVIRSHQIEGWRNFALGQWVSELVGLPAVLGNDADVAGLGEALFGAGKEHSPVFYITVGSGIGGGLIVDGEIYRGCGRGAGEIGHLRILLFDAHHEGTYRPLEEVASGWGIERHARAAAALPQHHKSLLVNLAGGPDKITTRHVGEAATRGDEFARFLLKRPLFCLAEAMCDVIALLAPRRIVVGGGVAQLGPQLFFDPLRKLVAERVFKPFAHCYDIVPAELGEEVVVHGALALARKRLGTGP
jgi:glucokinase